MNDLKRATETYVAAFDRRDLPAVEALMHDDFVLVDPAGRFEGKARVAEYIRGIFEAASNLRFRAKKIVVGNDATVIEFELNLGDKHLIGTDVIEWRDDRMSELRAYLYEAQELRKKR